MNAFVIEDDVDIGMLFEAALQDAGFEVEVIRSGTAAVARLQEIAPKLVCLDLNLPGMNGDEILAFIRTQPHLSDVRVVMITGNAAKAAELSEITDLVLLKPITYSQLRDLALRITQV
jgi:DNA-binding response OmpR family regulator